jgi:hypothetical protein
MEANARNRFDSDAEYLDAERTYLRARSHRISAEKSGREPRCRLAELREIETSRRAELDAQLVAHRQATGHCPLALDLLCERHQLSDIERFVLICAALPGIHQNIAEDALSGIVAFCGATSVADLIALLDPRSIADFIVARRLFHRNATLVRTGLIVLGEPRGEIGPDTLLGLDVRLSLTCFAQLVGEDSIVDELAPVAA